MPTIGLPVGLSDHTEGIAVAIAALGPIPATGLAHHPATEFARFVGGHIGVSETSAPPNVPPVTEVIEGADLTAKEASALAVLAKPLDMDRLLALLARTVRKNGGSKGKPR